MQHLLYQKEGKYYSQKTFQKLKKIYFREAEWLFSTANGRKKLVEITKYNRLAIVTLHRDQKYESFEAVQTELSNVVCNLAPAQLKNRKVYF